MSNAPVRCAAIARGRALGLRQALAGSSGSQHNARASFRIGGGGVVLQRNAQMAADIWQARGAQLDDGGLWPPALALQRLGEAEEARSRLLVSGLTRLLMPEK